MSLTIDDLKILKAEFPKDVLGVKVQSLSKAKNMAMLVLYLQHTDVLNRLEEVDPAWSAEAIEVSSTQNGCWVRMKMTLKGVSRENVGEGNDAKGAYSDALKRCAMLFGVGRFLYDSQTVWVPYSEETHKFKVWTYAEYEAAKKPVTPKPQAPIQKPVVTPRGTVQKPPIEEPPFNFEGPYGHPV